MKNLKRSLNQSIEDNINIKKLQLFDKEIFRAIKFIFKSLNNGEDYAVEMEVQQLMHNI